MGLVTKLEKEKLQLSAGRLRGVHSHAKKHRTGSTAKYLYQRKQAAQQLDMGACQASLLLPHTASSPSGCRSPHTAIPAHAPLPGGGVSCAPARSASVSGEGRGQQVPRQPSVISNPPWASPAS